MICTRKCAPETIANPNRLGKCCLWTPRVRPLPWPPRKTRSASRCSFARRFSKCLILAPSLLLKPCFTRMRKENADGVLRSLRPASVPTLRATSWPFSILFTKPSPPLASIFFRSGTRRAKVIQRGCQGHTSSTTPQGEGAVPFCQCQHQRAQQASSRVRTELWVSYQTEEHPESEF